MLTLHRYYAYAWYLCVHVYKVLTIKALANTTQYCYITKYQICSNSLQPFQHHEKATHWYGVVLNLYDFGRVLWHFKIWIRSLNKVTLSLRQEDLDGYARFMDIDPKKLLRPSQTRWLSLKAVVCRVLDQLPALRSYFMSEQPNSKVSKVLSKPVTELYLAFLNENLGIFTSFNLLFQVRT